MSRKFTSFDDELLIEKVREFPSLYDHENKDYRDHQIRENIWSRIGAALSKRYHLHSRNLPLLLMESCSSALALLNQAHAEDCKMRWKNVRDNYYKLKRKQKQSTGSAASNEPKWPLFGHLTFLELTKSERRRIGNFNESQNTQDPHPIANESVDDDISDSESQQNTDSIDVDNTDDDVGGGASESGTDFLRHNAKRLKPNDTEDTGRSDTPLSRRSAPSSNTSTSSSIKNKLLQNLEERSQKRLEIISQLAHQKEEDDVDLFMRSVAMMVKKLPPHAISQAKFRILTLVTELRTQQTTPLETYASDSNQPSFSGSLPSVLAQPQAEGTPNESAHITTVTPDVYTSTSPYCLPSYLNL